ncbi:uncharacterized protein LOC131951326 [Physella acuta]|uniref:uncharacterized protein LOC131951326 n=1 Tax=Physella acuta TaxID=109671 RepID=UPI0027DB32F0|nr:uncharacterized protein LOC131951326 [Physella acuta]
MEDRNAQATVGGILITGNSGTSPQTATEESNDDLSMELSPWKNFRLSQVLLPVLCAAFIAVVVIVIACCLIKKKAKPFQRRRGRSIHTIESSHDTSEYGIYDVIDQVKVKGRQNDKSRRQDRLNSNCILVSQSQVTLNKLSNVFSTPISGEPVTAGNNLSYLLAPNSPKCTRHDWSKFDRKFSAKDDCSEKSSKSSKEEEEGIYETLDRYWTLNNSFKGVKCMQEQPSDSPGQNVADSLTNTLPHHCKYEKDSGVVSDAETMSVCSTTVPHLPERGGRDKILCQLTLFHISDEDESSRQAETVYYYVNLQSLSSDHTGNLPSMLQNARLQVVSETEVDVQKLATPNITLEPVENNKVPKINENTNRGDYQSKVSSPKSKVSNYEHFPRSHSKRNPILFAKKSESFRGASSELTAARESCMNRRRRSDSSNGEVPPNSPGNSPPCPASGPETEDILKKLGPLPPVPSSRSALCRSESEKCGHAKKAPRYVTASVRDRRFHQSPSQTSLAKYAGRPLPLSPERHATQSCKDNHINQRSISEEFIDKIKLSATPGVQVCEDENELGGAEVSVHTNHDGATTTESLEDEHFQAGLEDPVGLDDTGLDEENETCTHYFVLEPRTVSDLSDSSNESDSSSDQFLY